MFFPATPTCQSKDTQVINYAVCGVPVCARAFCTMLRINEKRVGLKEVTVYNKVILSWALINPPPWCYNFFVNHRIKFMFSEAPFEGQEVASWDSNKFLADRHAQVQWATDFGQSISGWILQLDVLELSYWTCNFKSQFCCCYFLGGLKFQIKTKVPCCG